MGSMGIRLIAMALAPIVKRIIGCRESFYGYMPGQVLRIFFLTNQKQITCITTVAAQDAG